MVIFHSYVNVYQRVNHCGSGFWVLFGPSRMYHGVPFFGSTWTNHDHLEGNIIFRSISETDFDQLPGSPKGEPKGS